MNMESILQQARVVLNDNSAIRFSDAQLELALASVMETINSRVPRILSIEITQMPVDACLQFAPEMVYRDVLAVECLDTTPPEEIAFKAEQGEDQLKLWLLSPLPVSVCQHWRVKMICDHNLEGMDGAETSTIPASCAALLVYGVAGKALQMRNIQLAESANQAGTKVQATERQSAGFEAQFQQLLSAWQSSQAAPAASLPTLGWPPV